MNQKNQRKIRNVFLALVLVYAGMGILLFLFQDLILFHPTPLEANYKFQFNQPFEEINIPVGKRNLSLVKFKPEGKSKGIVLFFHGNMKNVEHYKKYPVFFTSRNYEVWMPDYPGFGKSTGKRSEENMYKDALLVYSLAASMVSPGNLIIYGKSIGTGVASYIAHIKPCRRLVLETPYYSIDALAAGYLPIYPVAPMTKYSFPIHKYLQQVKIPVTIFHGTRDEVIPYGQALDLIKENPQAELVRIENGKHNNLFSYKIYQVKMDSLLN